jgi:hypothetical protein
MISNSFRDRTWIRFEFREEISDVCPREVEFEVETLAEN